MPLSPTDPDYNRIMQDHVKQAQTQRELAYQKDRQIKKVRKIRKFNR